MKFKKLLAVILTMAVCVSFMPMSVSAADTSKVSDAKFNGTLPVLPSTAGDAIAQTAINLAWPYGTPTSAYKYKSGSPRNTFKVAIDKVFPNRSSWGAKPKAGASCDVFVGTVIRYSGYDNNAPRGCSGAFTYYLNNPQKWTDTGIYKVKDMKPGDVIVWKKASGTKHTCIYVEVNGKGYIAEAHYNAGEFGAIDRVASDYNPSKYTIFNIYRANQPYTGSIDKGAQGIQVKRLQIFLNWTGNDCGEPDGSFGPKTEKALKAWQKEMGITADGRFGPSSLSAAKKFIPSTQSNSVKSNDSKKTYTGEFPELPNKYGLKKGHKGIQVKRLQRFLNWYGNYKLKIDGKFGPLTLKAVKKFQKDNNLKVDGKFGNASLKKAKTIKK